ncbi:MAG: DUF1294 domain-containing protein [Alcanivorax sp.]|jgi:uncharacterized membrane protein YsdA (DUF1294 family)/cold shock CspA family protein|uniref:DUF1294 domain-containing protein n=1 Tax=Alcanivorax sp. TaxID=1872427 RepID=UPI0032D8E994
MKKQSGTLQRWDDARGFGFIVDRKGRDIFVHITAFGKIRSRPKDGDKVLFRVEPDAAKGVRAIDVERCWRPAHLLLPEFLLPLLVVAVFYGAFWLFFSKNSFWVFLSPLLIFIAVLTFILFGLDKRAALNERQRVPENTLHFLSLAGGWPGALLARPLFRHKTRKQPFRTIFWLVVVINIALVGAFVFSFQAAPLRDWLDVQALSWLITLKEWGWIRGPV